MHSVAILCVGTFCSLISPNKLLRNVSSNKGIYTLQVSFFQFLFRQKVGPRGVKKVQKGICMKGDLKFENRKKIFFDITGAAGAQYCPAMWEVREKMFAKSSLK